MICTNAIRVYKLGDNRAPRVLSASATSRAADQSRPSCSVTFLERLAVPVLRGWSPPQISLVRRLNNRRGKNSVTSQHSAGLSRRQSIVLRRMLQLAIAAMLLVGIMLTGVATATAKYPPIPPGPIYVGQAEDLSGSDVGGGPRRRICSRRRSPSSTRILVGSTATRSSITSRTGRAIRRTASWRHVSWFRTTSSLF